MSTQFGSYRQSIQELKNVILGINQHSECSPLHGAGNDKMIIGIELAIAQLEKVEIEEMETMAAQCKQRLDETIKHALAQPLDEVTFDENDLPF